MASPLKATSRRQRQQKSIQIFQAAVINSLAVISDSEGAPQITALLQAWRGGEPEALDQLMGVVHPMLRSLASRYLSRENPGHTLSATALVHEAYLKMLGARIDWDDRVHFFAVCARAMRHILVDHAKTKRRLKRGGPAAKVSLEKALMICSEPEERLLDLDEALGALASIDTRKAELVELVYFGGMSHAEAASALNISEATAQRDLRLARAWLYRELN